MQRRSQKRHIRGTGIAGVYNSKTNTPLSSVHKNDTTAKAALDSLARRGDGYRAHRIDFRIELFPRPAFSTLKAHKAQKKEHTPCARTAASSSPSSSR
jgi:hypothetical protein